MDKESVKKTILSCIDCVCCKTKHGRVNNDDRRTFFRILNDNGVNIDVYNLIVSEMGLKKYKIHGKGIEAYMEECFNEGNRCDMIDVDKLVSIMETAQQATAMLKKFINERIVG